MATENSRPAISDETRYMLPLVLADDLTEGLVVIDRESVIQYANPAMTRIFAYGRDELEGEPLTMLMPEPFRERHQAALDRYLATGVRSLPWSDVELPGRHRDGHRLDLRISFTEFSRGGRRLFAGTIRDLTAAKDPEEEQAILARSYRVLFEDDVAAVFRCAPDGRILAANGALARMTGRKDRSELQGRDVASCWAEGEEREKFVRDLRRQHDVNNRELRLRRADGSDQWSLVNAVWIDDPADDEPEMLVGTVVDISDRKRVERELRLSEERFRGVFDISPVALEIVRPETGERIEVNEQFEEVFGHDRAALLDGSVASDELWEDRGERARLYRRLDRGEDVRKAEVRLRRRDGSAFDALVSASLLRMDGDELVVAAIQDVTEERRQEEALRRSEARHRTLVETMAEATVILDREGRITFANEEAEKLLGLDASDLRGRAYDDPAWSITAPDGRPFPDEELPFRRVLETNRPVRNVEHGIEVPDGTRRIVSINAAPLPGDDDRMEAVVATIRDVTERSRMEEELRHRSVHDALTGLPNRDLFWDRLEHALDRSARTGEGLAVLFLDLDGFKRINDEHGHAAGDEALRQVADRLRGAVREADTLARLGGDEFGVLLEDLEQFSEADEVAGRLTEQFGAPISVAGEDALLRVSCGIALAGGDRASETVTADELVRRADRAMYAAKEEPGSTARRFGPEIAEQRTGRLRREIELKEALEAGHVVPHYQPVVDLADGRIVGGEALARWEHPDRGLIGPGAFIPLAEETGLIVELGRQVVRAACEQLVAWRADGLVAPGFRLHVNLSARELDRPDVVSGLEEMFRDLGLAPEHVAFEVTETVAIESSHVLERIRTLGSPMAVDDFGTGYATLERLASLDLDSLKLDRLFVDRIGQSGRHEAVLEASLTLAESMGLSPVAEGVETGEQRSWLLEHGCRFGQGFLFSRAVPADTFAGWLRSGEGLPA